MESRADGAELDPQGGRDLLVGQSFEIAEYHHDAAVLGQLGDGAMEGGFHLAALGTRVGPSVRVGHAEQDLFAMAHRVALSHGQAVEAEPRHDGVQPGRELGVAAELRETPVGTEERLLRDFLGFGGAAQHAQSDAEDAVLMGGHELLEGPRVARPQPFEKCRDIGGLSFPHS